MTSTRPALHRAKTRPLPRASSVSNEVQSAHPALDAALAHRQALLLTVCHDVQQPLTVLLVQTQLLQRQVARADAPAPEKFGAHLEYIYAAAKRMRDMTLDLLDASLDDSGQEPRLVLVPTDLVALARRAAREHELVSDTHRILFEAEVPTLYAPVDETRVHRVLGNLLANAIKYSPDGGTVSLTVKPSPGSDTSPALLTVRDEGVGIPPGDLPHIFDRFHRGANVIGRFSGIGLGLASARELVELHGGSISVDSQAGKGSTFVVRLPRS